MRMNSASNTKLGKVLRMKRSRNQTTSNADGAGKLQVVPTYYLHQFSKKKTYSFLNLTFYFLNCWSPNKMAPCFLVSHSLFSWGTNLLNANSFLIKQPVVVINGGNSRTLSGRLLPGSFANFFFSNQFKRRKNLVENKPKDFLGNPRI